VKKVLNWVKAQWLVVLFLALVLIAVPCGFIFGRMWHSKILEEQAKLASDKQKAIDGAKVTYSVASPVPGVPGIDDKGEPNAKKTEFFTAAKARFEAESKGVVEAAIAHHAGSPDRPRFPVLVQDLFPSPKNPGDLNRRTLDFVKALVGDDKRPSAYKDMLAIARAGSVADPKQVAQELADEYSRQLEQVRGNNKDFAMDEAQEKRIKEIMVGKRLGLYQRRASDIGLYATTDNLPANPAKVLRVIPATPPSIQECFAWQADLWAITEVIRAIALANTPAGESTSASVDRAVVKRLLMVEPLTWLRLARATEEEPFNQPEARPADTGAAVDGVSSLIAPKWGASVTGRWGGKTNKLYDVRDVRLTVIVSSARLPEFIDAISRSNFMAVTKVDLSKVDMWADLEAGYYYGEENVVRATIDIEMVWFKSWLDPIVPTTSLRDQLGLAPLKDVKEPPPAGPEGATPPGDGPPPQRGGAPRRGPRDRDR
jgi:hypothetical protein